jgi:hypothetical protein
MRRRTGAPAAAAAQAVVGRLPAGGGERNDGLVGASGTDPALDAEIAAGCVNPVEEGMG